MATSKNHTRIIKKTLVDFISQEDPILAMLEWTAQQMMQIEAEGIVGAKKGQHSKERTTYFSGKESCAWIISNYYPSKKYPIGFLRTLAILTSVSKDGRDAPVS